MRKTTYYCDRCGLMTTQEIVLNGEKYNLRKDLCSVCQKEYEQTVFTPYMKAREKFLARKVEG